MKRMIMILTTLAAVSCGSSPPTRFFTLDPTPGSRSPTPVQTPIKIDAVHIPSLLDRKTIVRGESNYQLSISSQDRWAADFDEMVRRVLTQDLENRLPTGTVISPNSPAPADARGIVVDILSFEPNGTGAVALDAAWTLLQGSPPHPMLQRRLQLSAPAEATAGSQAAAMSQLVGKLADSIVTGVNDGTPPQ